MKIKLDRVFIGGGRRHITLPAACRAEASARVRKAYGGPMDRSAYGKRLINRYARLLEREHRRTTP